MYTSARGGEAGGAGRGAAARICVYANQGIIVSKNQIIVPPENDVFDSSKGIGCQLRFQIIIRMKRADPCFGVCPNSAWSPSYETNI